MKSQETLNKCYDCQFWAGTCKHRKINKIATSPICNKFKPRMATASTTVEILRGVETRVWKRGNGLSTQNSRVAQFFSTWKNLLGITELKPEESQ